MAFDVTFSPAAWLDYMYWQTQDAKTLLKSYKIFNYAGFSESSNLSIDEE